MDTLKDKEVALLCIRNLNRYLGGEIKKEEWEENLRRINDMLRRQQPLPLYPEGRTGLLPRDSVSRN